MSPLLRILFVFSILVITLTYNAAGQDPIIQTQVHCRSGENSLDISAFNHNAFGGFLGVRIGLCSSGEGVVKFRHFTYKPIK